MKRGPLSALVVAGFIGFAIQLPLDVATAQTSSLFPLRTGKTYYIDFLSTSGIVTLVSLPGTDGWAVVEIQSGFEDAKLVSWRQVGLNLNLAVLIEERAEIPKGPKLNAVINDLNIVATNAYQYRIQPTTMGGGGGYYLGYTIPTSLSEGVKIVRVSREDIVFEKDGVRVIVNVHGKIAIE